MKKVLLIAGGGTLGMYTAQELLKLGHKVDIICLEDHVSHNENLRFFKNYATVEYLQELFKENRYDGIVNFLHYKSVEGYKPFHELLSKNTDHLIFLSSYRVYADVQHPITEDAPQLIDVVKDDPVFFETEDYALPKSRAERYLAQESGTKNWTIVRPVISFSQLRMDLGMVSGQVVIKASKKGTPVRLPAAMKDLTAGLDWAGNSGKIIANLLFKEETKGQAYTISTAQNLTWGQVAEIYAEELGVSFDWIEADYPNTLWVWRYDRAFDRRIDNSKVLAATGLTMADFKSIREGICIELDKLGAYNKNE